VYVIDGREIAMEFPVMMPGRDSMKRLNLIAGILFIFCMTGVAMAQENMSGIWDEDADLQRSEGVSNFEIIYAQFGNQLQATGYFEYRGVSCVWAGTGTVKGSTVEVTVNYSKRYPGQVWKGADGRFVLTLSADGRTLTGKWYNNNGDSGPKTFVKRK
jgi:hypothetical protein